MFPTDDNAPGERKRSERVSGRDLHMKDFQSQQAEHPVLLFPKHTNLQGIDGRSPMGSGLTSRVEQIKRALL
jgi:hypothetical protein